MAELLTTFLVRLLIATCGIALASAQFARSQGTFDFARLDAAIAAIDAAIAQDGDLALDSASDGNALVIEDSGPTLGSSALGGGDFQMCAALAVGIELTPEALGSAADTAEKAALDLGLLQDALSAVAVPFGNDPCHIAAAGVRSEIASMISSTDFSEIERLLVMSEGCSTDDMTREQVEMLRTRMKRSFVFFSTNKRNAESTLALCAG
ncbi:MAG: hypothetical protein AAFQ19_09290 [Pseudomonadota bacterium]